MTGSSDHDDPGHVCPVSGVDGIDVPVEAYAHRPGFALCEVTTLNGHVDPDRRRVLAGTAVFPGTGQPLNVFATYWRPTPNQLAAMNEGGFVEVILWGVGMAPHNLNVWAPSDITIDDLGPGSPTQQGDTP